MPRALPLDPTWEFDFTHVYAGKQLEQTFLLKDPDGDIIDLTGYTAAGKVTDEDGATVITLTITAGGTAGTLTIDQLISAAIPPGRLDWKAELIDSGGSENVRFRGKFNVLTY